MFENNNKSQYYLKTKDTQANDRMPDLELAADNEALASSSTWFNRFISVVIGKAAAILSATSAAEEEVRAAVSLRPLLLGSELTLCSSGNGSVVVYDSIMGMDALERVKVAEAPDTATD